MQVGDICTRAVICASAETTVVVQRMPILDSDANLVGIISVDDVIEILAGKMNYLAHLSREQLQPREIQDKLELR